MSKTLKVHAQSTEPEGYVKNARQTNNTKQDKMWVMHMPILIYIYIAQEYVKIDKIKYSSYIGILWNLRYSGEHEV